MIDFVANSSIIKLQTSYEEPVDEINMEIIDVDKLRTIFAIIWFFVVFFGLFGKFNFSCILFKFNFI